MSLGRRHFEMETFGSSLGLMKYVPKEDKGNNKDIERNRSNPSLKAPRQKIAAILSKDEREKDNHANRSWSWKAEDYKKKDDLIESLAWMIDYDHEEKDMTTADINKSFKEFDLWLDAEVDKEVEAERILQNKKLEESK